MFPFSVWVKLLRDVTEEDEATLLTDTSAGGIRQLRPGHFRPPLPVPGMTIDPEQIVVGREQAGVLIQLLGRRWGYAVEDPGYLRLGKIYEKRCGDPPYPHGRARDHSGTAGGEAGAQILHITPFPPLPYGDLVMPIAAGMVLTGQGRNRYIIEDDYDCGSMAGRHSHPTGIDSDGA